ncbi:hypothetical protein Pfo_007547 [Paulownia fortunei]|nr:hypothetical protein Pfo_007547 [Paulownia fortunei]
MKSKNMSLRLLLFPCTLLLLFCSFATCDIDKDKEKCANDLVGLATCLPYVSGESKAPPIDCCTGLKQVLQKSPECICLLVKDRNDPSLGLKINATLALSLPSQCHAPANISDCPGDMFDWVQLCCICHQIHQMLRCLRILQTVPRKAMVLHLLLKKKQIGMKMRWIKFRFVSNLFHFK